MMTKKHKELEKLGQHINDEFARIMGGADVADDTDYQPGPRPDDKNVVVLRTAPCMTNKEAAHFISGLRGGDLTPKEIMGG